MSDKTDKNIPKWVLIVKKMDKKQTAVEWLLNNLHEIGVNNNISIKAEKGWLEKRNEIIKQAKAMEKEQLIDAYYQCGRDNFEHIKVINRSATDYYNETYNSKQ